VVVLVGGNVVVLVLVLVGAAVVVVVVGAIHSIVPVPPVNVYTRYPGLDEVLTVYDNPPEIEERAGSEVG
jgi:hypothetical protein